MTLPVSAPPRRAGRGMNALLAGSALLALAWLCAMLYVVAAWVLA
ncbi:morphogenic membrane protein MmpA [Streptomyces sp. NPDC054975]